MRPSDKWENLAEIIGAIEPSLEARLRYCRSHPLDPAKQPVTSAIITAYVHRLELALSAIRGGADGLKDEATNRPESTQELQEFESWILRRKPGLPRHRRKMTAKDEDVIGDWFVIKQGYSYSKARRMLAEIRSLQSGKGAPNKRPETLKILDARICNDWSYPELAARMCDCGATEHTDHCSERIRKRLKELESFLNKYGIPMPSAKRPEKNQS